MLRFFHELRNNPQFDPSFDQLVDVANAATALLTYATLDSVRRADPFGASKRAIVVHSDVDFGVARMYEGIHGGNIQVFKNLSEAMAFLGLPTD